MKKDILVFGSLLFLMSVSGAALAQNCTSPTRCDELGYTFSAEDCKGIRSLICPFDSNKYFCSEAGDPAANATPGMILYSDGTVSYKVIPEKTPVGVVAYIEGTTRLAVALEDKIVYFSTGYEDVSCLTNYSDSSLAQTDFNGAANTQCIINYSSSYSYPAAEYCNTYKPVSSGTGSNGWYLPAAGELYAIKDDFGAINAGLQKLSKTQLRSTYHWSSSEFDNSYAWYVILPIGSMEAYNKDDYYYRNAFVRCFLAF